jgi:3-oxo-5-alpha-steroid 4-dehydrogenase 1
MCLLSSITRSVSACDACFLLYYFMHLSELALGSSIDKLMDQFRLPHRLADADFHRSIAWSVIALSPLVVFALVVLKPSTYGKLMHKRTNLFGPMVSAKWCWIIFESPNWVWVLYSLLLVILNDEETDGRSSSSLIIPLPNSLLLGWFFLHYLHRSILYPLQLSSDSKFPIGILVFTVPYTMVNGYLQSQGLLRFQTFPPNYLFSLSFAWGSIITVLGFTIAFISDQTLLQLRRSSSSCTTTNDSTGTKTTTTIYQIPYGGLFQYVSCPHFLGEIVEWIGFCIACHGSLASASFAIWTMANLGPRALAQHEWYQQKFDDYPKDRKAIVPFLV